MSLLRSGGAGRDANDDKRIDLNEWLGGYKGVNNHGFLALKGISTKEQAVHIFTSIDDNGGGIIMLDEWCVFIKNAEVQAKTPVGKLLSAEESVSSANERQTQAQAKAAKDSKPPPKRAEKNSFGFTVGKGKAGASKDYHNFAACFEPMCAETPEGKKLRDEGFLAADPNGNGLCSLSELETFVLRSLLAKYPNSPKTSKGEEPKTPGQDLFKAFRPCYIRAFKDAADYGNDDAPVKGTKNAKQDDYVTKDEFRFFCVYIIIYAAMFDAFAKIDGGIFVHIFGVL